MNELDQLRKENAELKDEISRLKNRGAGRHNKFNAYQISNMKNARHKGLTYKQIAEIYNCSTSLIHKLINEK
ncbi:hypothetical protein CBU02nite_16330 [Clostridium butyricum]|uniref:Resolvase HTH domain-containing protein n=1 Tax=Clostridium butyricum TaxID=1492 RepID=A0A512TLI9_CLOBU|nr:hypothetical protein [Clostridium butyricum]NOW23932.1 cell division protein FtsB [Clostridium butyricum]GEQ21127.1 hypothetical protein CBU02nite_16330 [Clostridium butyricum]